MQAIVTKYYPPGNVKGARIKASCQAKIIWVPYEYTGTDHQDAAKKLATMLGWEGEWFEGGMPDGRGCCFVNTNWYFKGREEVSFVVDKQ